VVHEADFNLVSLPDHISFITAASLGCRFGTAYHALTSQAEIKEGQSIMIMGCGGVGLSAVMIGTALGANVIAVDINDAKLDLAKQLGANVGINLITENVTKKALLDLIETPVDITIDALGKEEVVNFGLDCLRPRGKHIQIGLMEGELPRIAMNLIISKEIKVIGSHGVAASKYPEIFDLISSGKCDPAKLVTGVISLDESPEFLEKIGTDPPDGVVVIDLHH
jgi:alcohol dehydrogenase